MAQISGKVLLIYTNLWCSSLSHRLICADAKLITYKKKIFNPNLARLWVEDEAKNGVVCLARKYCTKKKVNLFGLYSSFIRQWYFQQITASIQTKQKVSKLPSLNVVANKFAGEVQEEVQVQCMLQQTDPGTSTRAWLQGFMEKKSLVQETIDAAGHLCLFLLKFYCELNTFGE